MSQSVRLSEIDSRIKSERTGRVYEVRPIQASNEGYLIFLMFAAFIVFLVVFFLTPGLPLGDGQRLGFDLIPYWSLAVVGLIWAIVVIITVLRINRLTKRDKLVNIINQAAFESDGDNSLGFGDIREVDFLNVDDYLQKNRIRFEDLVKNFPQVAKDIAVTEKVDNFQYRMEQYRAILDLTGPLPVELSADANQEKKNIRQEYESLQAQIQNYPGLQSDLKNSYKGLPEKFKPKTPLRRNYRNAREEIRRQIEDVNLQKKQRYLARKAGEEIARRNTIRFDKLDGSIVSGPATDLSSSS